MNIQNQYTHSAVQPMVMDKNNFSLIKKKNPDQMHKVFYLGKQQDIEDPYGADESVFKKTYQEIVKNIDAIFANHPN